MIAANGDATKQSRIAKLEQLRDYITSWTDRIHGADQRVCVLRRMHEEVAYVYARRDRDDETGSTSSRVAEVKAQFQIHLESIPDMVLLSNNSRVLRFINTHLRALMSDDDITECIETDSETTRGERCPILKTPYVDPFFSRSCDHRHSESGLLQSFNQCHGEAGRMWAVLSDIPTHVTVSCPVAGCPVLLAVCNLQRDFQGVDDETNMPESSPLDTMESQINNSRED